MQPLDIVEHCETGKRGVVHTTIPICPEDGPLSVTLDGTSVASAFDGEESKFKVVGRYDPSVANEKGCGMGRGEKACRFLGVTGSGLVCLRFGEMHWSLIFKSGKSRDPRGNYPDCQLKD